MPPDDDVIDSDGEAPVIVLEGAALAATATAVEGTGGCGTMLATLCSSGTWE